MADTRLHTPPQRAPDNCGSIHSGDKKVQNSTKSIDKDVLNTTVQTFESNVFLGCECNFRGAGIHVSYLHDIHCHPMCGHTLHVVDQPMNNLRADEAVGWQTLLLGE